MPRPTPPPSQLAENAAEAVRALNHATLEPAAYPYPSEVDATVQALITLAGRLPQAIVQSDAALAALDTAGRLRLDAMTDSPSLEHHLAAVHQATDHAQRAAEDLTAALKRLGSLTSHLAWDDTEQATGASG